MGWVERRNRAAAQGGPPSARQFSRIDVAEWNVGLCADLAVAQKLVEEGTTSAVAAPAHWTISNGRSRIADLALTCNPRSKVTSVRCPAVANAARNESAQSLVAGWRRRVRERKRGSSSGDSSTNVTRGSCNHRSYAAYCSRAYSARARRPARTRCRLVANRHEVT